MPILTENCDRPGCLPGSKDEPFLPSIKTAAVSPRGPPGQGSSRENKQAAALNSNKSNSKGNNSSRKNNNSNSNSNANTQRSVNNGGELDDDGENYDNYFTNNNNINSFNDRNHTRKDSLNSRLGQLQNQDDGGPGLGQKAFFSAPASESSTPFKLPSIDRSKSNSVSSLVSERHLQYRHHQNMLSRGRSRDRRSRLCRSPSCPSNLGYWQDNDEDDYFDDDDDGNNNQSRAYNYQNHGDAGFSMITPDTARLSNDRLSGFLEGGNLTNSHKLDGGFLPSSQSSSRPHFGHREDSCTITNGSIKLPSIFPSRGSHNSSFLTTTSSLNGGGMSGGPEGTMTADSSAVTSRDGSPFAFKREPTFSCSGTGRRDNHQANASNKSPHTLSPDAASKVAAKLTAAANGLSPRPEVEAENDDDDPHNSTINSTRSSHHSGYNQHFNHHQQHQHHQQQHQQSTALLLPISSTFDPKHSSNSGGARNSGSCTDGCGAGKRKRKKNTSKPLSHGLGDPVSDAATERLLREKLGAIERRDKESYSPTRESARESGISTAEGDEFELSDMNLIERVKNETNERNSMNLCARDRDSKMSGSTVDGVSAKPPVYQNTPTRIKTEKKVASVKA
ncbi:hypothetical protein PoB_007176200 [Plakobranchus ocellatus]|uniref:Uncharacterized protein n=1 Tax=Plakobranchus ocellatus TaxID=259542 RepID=A0AAV4DLS4_9GAST|nr:hypothetical protein PoB_007176200 [Plakobranchus ocellatus]